jgi:serine protease Do
MRFANLAALVALTSFSAQSTFAQSLLSQVEQGLQAPGGAQANGYLGAELDDEGQMNKGVLVTAIRPGTAAEKGGLKAGDLITHVDGKAVPNLDAYDAVAKRPAGTAITMTIVRDGRTQALPVTLGTKTAAPGSNPADVTPAPTTVAPPASPAAPGLTPPSLTPPGPAPSGAAPSLLPPTGAASPSSAEPAPRSSGIIATPQTTVPPPGAAETPFLPGGAATSGGASLGVTLPPPGSSTGRTQRGALIAMVKPGTPAEQAGLKAGQLIVGIDGKRIESDDELIAAIKARQPGQSVEIRYRDGESASEIRTTTVRLAQAGAPAAAPSGAATPGTGLAPRTGSGSNPPGAFAPGPFAPGPGSAGLSPGGRLLDRVERIADNLAPRPLSTVYDPQAFASLQARVEQLESRLRALENKAGITPSGSGAPAGSPTAPGFGSPTTPSTTPGFGPPGGTSP